MKKTFVRVGLSLVGLFLLATSFSGPSVFAARAKKAKAQAVKSEEIQGELEVIVEDQKASAQTFYNLKSGGKTYRLNFSKEPSQKLHSGMNVSVRGSRSGDLLTADSITTQDATNSFAQPGGSVESSVLPNTIGEHKVLVILVNFQDKQTQPFTADQARDVTFNTTSNYFREVSYGQTWLTGDVYGWYTIPISSTVCDTDAIATYAKQAAANAGANLGSYNNIVYGFPSNVCSFTGSANLGGSQPQVWINEWYELGVLGHELGHNFGLSHSKSLDCGALSIGTTCTSAEYGDTVDLMGGAAQAHYNLFQKELLGWINYGASPSLQTIAASGTYSIDTYETFGTGPKGLKVLKSTDPVSGAKTWYYIEKRAAAGFDSTLGSNPNVMSGVIIHQASDGVGQTSYLLDMTPGTTSWNDPALTVGQAFIDADAGVTITVVSADAAGASVRVDMNVQTQPCTRYMPTVTMTPGQSQLLSAGAAFTYSVTVKNNDSARCAAQNFSLTSVVPSGWTSDYSSGLVSLSPSGSASIALTVTSPLGTPDGNYTVLAGAGTGSKSEYAGSASAVYSVVSPLTMTVASGSKSYSRTQKASVTAAVRVNGTAKSGAVVSFTMTKPNGSAVTQSVTTGSNGNAVFTYSFNKKSDPLGTYQVKAASTVNGQTVQGSTTFSVNK
jgi:hypothetical protein